jgi:hypothetical protein
MSRMTRNGLVVAVAILSLAQVGDLAAKMYRWVDADGVTVYSQQPPPDAAATRIAPDAAPSEAETQRAIERVNRINNERFDRRDDAARQAEETARQEQEQSTRRANCDAARKNLQTIDTLGARRVRTPDGEYRFLSDSERAKHRARAQVQIKENCD